MQSHKKLKIAFLLLPILIYSGCAASNVPDNWLSEPEDMATNTYGGWITVDYSSNLKEEFRISGELIAISNDSVYVLNEIFYAISKNDILSARLVCYESNYGKMAPLVLLGTLSTISNGWFLIFTAPMWIIGGTISTATRSHAPIINFPQTDFDEFVPYARFPQGLPKGINRNKIKMKQLDI